MGRKWSLVQIQPSRFFLTPSDEIITLSDTLGITYMAKKRELLLRSILITMCLVSGLAESITLSYFVLIQLGYAAFVVFVAAIFHFSVMDGFNVLWNGSRHIADILQRWWKDTLLAKRAITAFVMPLFLYGGYVFSQYYFAATYFHALLFMFTYFHQYHAYFPLVLGITLIPTSVITTVNILANALRLVDSMLQLFLDFLDPEHELCLDKVFLSRTIGYAAGAVLACVFTEVTYLSLSYGMHHYYVFTAATAPIYSVPILLITMFCAVMHTMRQIVNYLTDTAFCHPKVSHSYWQDFCARSWGQKMLQIWGWGTYLLRGYAKAVGAAISLTRGFMPIFTYNFLDKLTSDPVSSVVLLPVSKQGAEQRDSTKQPAEVDVAQSLADVMPKKS